MILAVGLGVLAASARAETVTSVTQFGYDAAGRPICATVRMNTAAYASAPGACTLGTQGADGPDRITYTEYDSVDRVTKVTSGHGSSPRVEKTVTYTDNGKEATVADGKGNLTTYEYDGFDRLAKVRYPNALCCTSSTVDFDAYGYDANGNRATWLHRPINPWVAGQTVTYTYDALNRVTYHDGVPTWVYYDNLDRMTSTYSGPGADKIVAQYYDGLGRPSYAYDYRDGTWFPTYNGYDLAGRRTLLQWSDGNYVNYDYNAAGEMVGVRENGGSSYLASLGYDNLGRRTHLLRGNGVITWYEYDNASRLNGLHHDVAGTDQSWIYTHNAASQVKTQASYNSAYNWTPGPAASRSYAINGLNQATTAGALNIAYDGRGNLISDGTTGYGYDADNRLTSAWGASNATLTYDPLGRLGQTAGATTTRFAYSGTDLIAELNTSNAILRRFVPGPGTDEPLVWYEGSGMADRRWLLPDAQGSIVAVTNNTGAVTNVNTYDEYGLPAAGNLGRFQYTGQTWIPELGLYNYKARFYSPTLGRFLQTDPIGYDDGLNWYAYVGNDPMNRTDPTGQMGIFLALEAARENEEKQEPVEPAYVSPPQRDDCDRACQWERSKQDFIRRDYEKRLREQTLALPPRTCYSLNGNQICNRPSTKEESCKAATQINDWIDAGLGFGAVGGGLTYHITGKAAENGRALGSVGLLIGLLKLDAMVTKIATCDGENGK